MANLFKTVVEDGMRYLLDYYAFSTTFISLAPSATLSAVINVEADSDFVVERLSYFSHIAGAGQTAESRVIPLVKLGINDTGSGRYLQNEPVYLNSIAGTGELPFVLPLPRVFSANSSINLTLENASATVTYGEIQITLCGYKKFLVGKV